MADNRRIKNKVRGEAGQHYDYGNEDQLAAAYDQTRLDELKAAGAIEGDWSSTKSPLAVSGDGAMSKELSDKIEKSGAEMKTLEPGDGFQPLSVQETLDAMKKMDFSEPVTRSMTFHGDALKEAMKSSNKPGGATGEKKKDPPTSADYPEDFPAYGKNALQKLGVTLAEAKAMKHEDLTELDGIADKSADEIIEYFAKTGANK